MANNRELIKIDKNGTKYWREMVRCSKCGGSGSISWTDYADGVCFDCHGAGSYEEITKEYTPEHEAKLQRARQRRWEKRMAEERAKAQELNLKFFKDNGFDSEGNIWCILGDTFSIKEELKELGCRFSYYSDLGWHCDHELAGYPSIKLTASQICNQNDNGLFVSWKNEELSQLISEAQEALKKETEPESNYVGAVGDKIELTATFKREFTYKVKIDWMTQTKSIYIFTDENGNQLTWNTTACIEAAAGDQVKLRGTIKAHREYKGIKQTELQRCKITKEEN